MAEPPDHEELLERVNQDPQAARCRALELLAEADGDGDAGTASFARRVLGLAARELNDLPEALRQLTAAVDGAEAAGLPERAAQARMSRALTYAYRGDNVAALHEIDAAAGGLRGGEAARLEVQRALILQRQGRMDEALEGYRKARVGLRRSGDRLWEARLLNNRGILHEFRGALADAESDYRAAAALLGSLGQEAGRAQTLHNLATVVATRGQIPEALTLFDEADRTLTALGRSYALGLREYGEALLSVRLVREARATAERAVLELGEAGLGADLAEAQLLLAEAALLDDDVATARTVASEARAAFEAQHRDVWAALARFQGLRAEWAAGERGASTLAESREVADELAAAGWAVPAAEARLMAARLALWAGDVDLARSQFELVSAARRRGPMAVRAQAWHAEGILRLAGGDRRGASRALQAGLDVVDTHRAMLGATELRAHVSGHAAELAATGLGMALGEGRAGPVLRWAERSRASVLLLPPAQPSDDDELNGHLTNLRRVVAEQREEADDSATVRALAAEQQRLEHAIRRRLRHGPSAVGPTGGGSALSRPPTVTDLAGAVGDRAFVEFVGSDGDLHAVTVAGGRARVAFLGAMADVEAEIDALGFGLWRLADRRRPGQAQAAASAAAGYAARRLDEILLVPLRAALGDRDLIVSPTGPLHRLPWSVLPGCQGRAVTVTPSAALWLRSQGTDGSGTAPAGRAVFVAGPGLEFAATEITDIAGAYPSGRTLSGAGATVQAVTEAIDGADLAHLATHCDFRSDNPLFSSLGLFDGPLTVYDLERLGRAPRLLLLAACNSGRADVRPGDELLGLAAAVLPLGTRTVVASVIEVPDEATSDLMVSLHAGLRQGLAPAAALARSQEEARRGGEPAAEAAAAAFVCVGSG